MIYTVCRTLQQQTDKLKQSHQTELEAICNKMLKTELALEGVDVSCY